MPLPGAGEVADRGRRRRGQPARRPAARGRLRAAAGRLRHPGWRSPARWSPSGRASAARRSASGSARWSPAAAMPNTASRRRRSACRCRTARWSRRRRCPRPSSPCGPTSSSAAGCSAGETAARPWRLERHRHDGDPARRTPSARASSPPPAAARNAQACEKLGADARDQLPARGFRRRHQGGDRRARRRRHPRHGRRRLFPAQHQVPGGRDGRLVQIAFLRGAKVEVNFMPVMRKRLTITGSTLRPRTGRRRRARSPRRCASKVWPLLEAGTVTPVIDAHLPARRGGRRPRRLEESARISARSC